VEARAVSGTQTPPPDLALLVAVADATKATEWATADEIRRALDGKHARGRWARILHDHTDAGYLERQGFSGPYALTDKAVEEIYEDRYV
jgi:hypothetical protein